MGAFEVWQRVQSLLMLFGQCWFVLGLLVSVVVLVSGVGLKGKGR